MLLFIKQQMVEATGGSLIFLLLMGQFADLCISLMKQVMLQYLVLHHQAILIKQRIAELIGLK
jgi:hypothetical protein